TNGVEYVHVSACPTVVQLQSDSCPAATVYESSRTPSGSALVTVIGGFNVTALLVRSHTLTGWSEGAGGKPGAGTRIDPVKVCRRNCGVWAQADERVDDSTHTAHAIRNRVIAVAPRTLSLQQPLCSRPRQSHTPANTGWAGAHACASAPVARFSRFASRRLLGAGFHAQTRRYPAHDTAARSHRPLSGAWIAGRRRHGAGLSGARKPSATRCRAEGRARAFRTCAGALPARDRTARPTRTPRYRATLCRRRGHHRRDATAVAGTRTDPRARSSDP